MSAEGGRPALRATAALRTLGGGAAAADAAAAGPHKKSAPHAPRTHLRASSGSRHPRPPGAFSVAFLSGPHRAGGLAFLRPARGGEGEKEARAVQFEGRVGRREAQRASIRTPTPVLGRRPCGAGAIGLSVPGAKRRGGSGGHAHIWAPGSGRPSPHPKLFDARPQWPAAAGPAPSWSEADLCWPPCVRQPTWTARPPPADGWCQASEAP